MKNTIDFYIGNLNKNTSPDDSDYEELIIKIDFKIDNDFLQLIKLFNGLSGPLGSSYVLIWKIQEMIKLNPYYDFIEECSNLFFFGSNGSSLGYAFYKANGSIVSIEFLDIGIEKPVLIAKSFEDFLVHHFTTTIG